MSFISYDVKVAPPSATISKETSYFPLFETSSVKDLHDNELSGSFGQFG